MITDRNHWTTSSMNNDRQVTLLIVIMPQSTATDNPALYVYGSCLIANHAGDQKP